MKEQKLKKSQEWIKKGEMCNYHSIIGGAVTKMDCIIKCDPYLMCGSLVVMLDNVRGCVSIDALSK